MLIEELLERLHAMAGLPAKTITPRMLEDWAYEDLISGPTQTGGWHWSEESLTAALEVIDYRKRGFKRVAAIKAQWWLEGGDFAVHNIREAIVSEYKRARNLALRLVSSAHGIRRDVDLTEYRRLALRRQLGPLDPILKQAGFDFGAAVTIAFYELARFGEQISPIDKNAEPLAALLASAMLPSGLNIFSGLLEMEDDHPLSAVRSIRQLTDKQFQECRMGSQLFPLGLILGKTFFGLFGGDDDAKHLAFTAAINSWSNWPWHIVIFALMANVYYHLQIKEIDK